MVGIEETRLVVLRGNSASGKSSVAAGLRERFGRGLTGTPGRHDEAVLKTGKSILRHSGLR
jgi:nicotinamide riboside kinase